MTVSVVTCDALVVVHAGDAHEGNASYAEEEQETEGDTFSLQWQMIYELRLSPLHHDLRAPSSERQH